MKDVGQFRPEESDWVIFLEVIHSLMSSVNNKETWKVEGS